MWSLCSHDVITNNDAISHVALDLPDILDNNNNNTKHHPVTDMGNTCSPKFYSPRQSPPRSPPGSPRSPRRSYTRRGRLALEQSRAAEEARKEALSRSPSQCSCDSRVDGSNSSRADLATPEEYDSEDVDTPKSKNAPSPACSSERLSPRMDRHGHPVNAHDVTGNTPRATSKCDVSPHRLTQRVHSAKGRPRGASLKN